MSEGAQRDVVRALRVNAHDADGVVLAGAELSPTGQDEVRIDVAAAGLNFPDLLMADGTYQSIPPVPFTLGMECAGVVSEVGEGVTEVAVGDRVLAMVPYGAFAEGLTVDATRVHRIPAEMSFEDAAAFGLAYATAYFALVRRARLKSGETVLVTGVTGGVGALAVQIAKARGARVIGVTRRPSVARELIGTSADAYVAATAATLRDEVKELTGGRGADVLIDVVGGDLLAQAPRCLAWEGRAVVVGFAGGMPEPVKPGHLLVKNIEMSGLQVTDYFDRAPEEVHAAMREGFELYRDGRLTVPVTRSFPLAQGTEALSALRRGEITGKAVLTVDRSA